MEKIGSTPIEDDDVLEDGTRIVYLAGYTGTIAVGSERVSEIINMMHEEEGRKKSRTTRLKPPGHRYFRGHKPFEDEEEQIDD